MIGFLFSLLATGILLASDREESGNYRAMFQARSAEKLRKILNDQYRFRHVKTVCDVQLKAGKIPLSCFELLKVEVARGEDHAETTWLERLCIERAADSADRKELARAEKTMELPAKCRQEALRRANDLRYSDQSLSPAELFAARHGANLE